MYNYILKTIRKNKKIDKYITKFKDEQAQKKKLKERTNMLNEIKNKRLKKK